MIQSELFDDGFLPVSVKMRKFLLNESTHEIADTIFPSTLFNLISRFAFKVTSNDFDFSKIFT